MADARRVLRLKNYSRAGPTSVILRMDDYNTPAFNGQGFCRNRPYKTKNARPLHAAERWADGTRSVPVTSADLARLGDLHLVDVVGDDGEHLVEIEIALDARRVLAKRRGSPLTMPITQITRVAA